MYSLSVETTGLQGIRPDGGAPRATPTRNVCRGYRLGLPCIYAVLGPFGVCARVPSGGGLPCCTTSAAGALHPTEHTDAAKRGEREGRRDVEVPMLDSAPMTKTFPQRTGATPTLLARHLGMGRGGSGLAEWPGKDASDPGCNPGVAEHRSLRRLGDLVGHFGEHVPERSFGGNRDKRQSVALLTRDGNAGGFSPLVNEGVCTVPGDSIPGSVSHHRHP
jgi:hypothetical protein